MKQKSVVTPQYCIWPVEAPDLQPSTVQVSEYILSCKQRLQTWLGLVPQKLRTRFGLTQTLDLSYLHFVTHEHLWHNPDQTHTLIYSSVSLVPWTLFHWRPSSPSDSSTTPYQTHTSTCLCGNTPEAENPNMPTWNSRQGDRSQQEPSNHATVQIYTDISQAGKLISLMDERRL